MDVVQKRVREMRIEHGLTQQQLAFDTGLSVGGIQSIEIGRAKPNIETLIKLAKRFGCSTDYLLGQTDDPNYQLEVTWNEFHQRMEIVAKALNSMNPEYAEEFRKSFEDTPRNDELMPPELLESFNEFAGPLTSAMKKLVNVLENIDDFEKKIKDKG